MRNQIWQSKALQSIDIIWQRFYMPYQVPQFDLIWPFKLLFECFGILLCICFPTWISCLVLTLIASPTLRSWQPSLFVYAIEMIKKCMSRVSLCYSYLEALIPQQTCPRMWTRFANFQYYIIKSSPPISFNKPEGIPMLGSIAS